MRAEKERGDARGIGRKLKKRKKAGWGSVAIFRGTRVINLKKQVFSSLKE